jgi:hypothetical protein
MGRRLRRFREESLDLDQPDWNPTDISPKSLNRTGGLINTAAHLSRRLMENAQTQGIRNPKE